MNITRIAMAAISPMLIGALVDGVAAASGVTPPVYGHTPREEWREAPIEDPLPNAAYFAVDLYYCPPPAATFVDITIAAPYPLTVEVAGGGAGRGSRPVVDLDDRPAPSGDAAIVYEEVLLGAHGGNCDDFYAKEVLPRLYLSDEQS